MKRHVFMMPHPPVLIEDIGGGMEQKAKETLRGIHELGEKIGELKPDVILFMTPHGISFSNGACMVFEKHLKGNFAAFGAQEIIFEKDVDTELTEKFYDAFEENGLVSVLMDRSSSRHYNVEVKLDHGAMVPMAFIDPYFKDYKIVLLSPGFTSLEENYQLGQCIGKVLDDYPKRVVIVSSGDLSHALSDQGPYAYNPKGPWFDDLIRNCIAKKDPMPLLALQEHDLEEAAQCGLRSFLIGMGSLDGQVYESKIHSYEGPFGVGYMTAELIGSGVSQPSILEQVKKQDEMIYLRRLENEDDHITLARKSIEYFVRTGKRLGESYVESHFSESFVRKCKAQTHGAFVSIHKDGKLRGCMGTIEAMRSDILEEIIYNAIMACSEDPRFTAVTAEELMKLDIKVDILGDNEQIDDPSELDVKRYGVIVEKGNRRGLLLPNLEGINTVEEQIDIAVQKAGIGNRDGMQLYRFEVERHEI